METETHTDSQAIVSEYEALIEVADILDLELRQPAGGNKWSSDLMENRPGRPPIGIQGRILDLMCDDLISTKQAIGLLGRVHARLKQGGGGGW
jgi:hypothetical protein